MKFAVYLRVGTKAQLGIVKEEKPFKPPVRRVVSQTSEKIELLVRWYKSGAETPKIWLLIADPINPNQVK